MKTPNSSNSSKGFGNTKQIPPSKHWCFTLNNYTLEDIIAISSIVPKKRYVFQEETGEEGTPHLQGYIEFEDKLRPSSLKLNKSIHWEKCRNIKQSILYCQKKESRTGEIFLFRIVRVRELVILTAASLFAWQEEVVNIIKQEPDDRSIHWYWEAVGKRGKSALVKYLLYHYNGLTCSGKASDMKYLIVQYEKKNGYYPELIIFDIPRHAKEYLSYSGIEEIKNGCFASTKYECEQVLMNSPHILCFANSEPDTLKMSEDRWVINEI